MINGINDELILTARLLLATLFLIFGCRKLRDYSGTVSKMVQLRAPMPVLAAPVAVFMELPVAFAVTVGAFVRPSPLLLFLYTLKTALIGHRYWTMKGADRVNSMDSFYKNLGIMVPNYDGIIIGTGQSAPALVRRLVAARRKGRARRQQDDRCGEAGKLDRGENRIDGEDLTDCWNSYAVCDRSATEH